MRSSIRTKLALTYALLILLVILVVGLYLTKRIERMVLDRQKESCDLFASQICVDYQHLCDGYESTLSSLQRSFSFVSFVMSNAESPYDAIIRQREMADTFRSMSGIDQKDIILRVYSANDTIRFSEFFAHSIDDFKKELWNAGDAPDGRWITTTKLKGRQENKYVGFYRTMRDSERNDTIVYSLFIAESKFYEEMTDWADYGALIYLIDSEGKVITSTERESVFRNADSVCVSESVPISAAEGMVSFNGAEYYVSRSKMGGDIGWSVITFTPTDNLTKSISGVWRSSLVLCGCCLLITLIITVFVTNIFVRRINNFLDNMQKVWDRNFEIQVPISGHDEISLIERAFNRLIGNIRQLIQNEYLSNIRASRLSAEKSEAELIALRSQINPHYLFNTLETIRMNLVLEGDQKNATALEMFSESFAECIGGAKMTHTLAEEMEGVQRYFDIQEYCYPGEIHFQAEIPDDLQGQAVPSLILQPLVENAVYHGVELKGEPGTVIVRAEKQLHKLCLTVKDDGVGMDTETLEALKRLIDGENAEQSKHHLALRNVNARLKLLYGEDYSLQIESERGLGTCVTITFPIAPE